MNALLLTLSTTIQKLKIGYGGEWAMGQYTNGLQKEEQNLQTEVQNATNRNKQMMLAAYTDLRYQWEKFTAYAGLRYEYTAAEYSDNHLVDNVHLPSPHFLGPSLSMSYSGDIIRMSLSYKRTIDRPAYSKLNNFIILENQYVYQQNNPYLFNQLANNVQFLANYKTVSFTAAYNIKHNLSTAILTPYGMQNDIILKQAVNIPDYSLVTVGLNWRDSFGKLTPSAGISVEQPFFSYNGVSYNKLYFNVNLGLYWDLGAAWSLNVYGSYSSRNHNLFSLYSRRGMYSLTISKELGNFIFDFGCSNLFLNPSLHTERMMNNITAHEVENRDFAGANLTIVYRFNVVNMRYRNRVQSNEGRRF